MTLALGRLFRRQPGPVTSAGLVVTLAAATLVLLMSGTKTYAQLAGAAAAALLPGLMLGMGKRTGPFSEHLAPAFVLVLGGLVIAGHWYASLTPLGALLLFVAPRGCGWANCRRSPGGIGGAGLVAWRRSLCRFRWPSGWLPASLPRTPPAVIKRLSENRAGTVPILRSLRSKMGRSPSLRRFSDRL